MAAVSSRTSVGASGASHIRACCSAAPARSPRSSSSSSSAKPACESSDHGVEPSPGATRTSLRTRSGLEPASSSATRPPNEQPTTAPGSPSWSAAKPT